MSHEVFSDIHVRITDFGDDSIIKLQLYWAQTNVLIYERLYGQHEKVNILSPVWGSMADKLIKQLGINGKRTLLTWVKLPTESKVDK